MSESSNGVPSTGSVTGPAAGLIVVRQSRLQRDGLFGVLIVVFGLALARGYTGAHTSTGRIAVAVFVCAVTAALVWAWVRLIGRPCRLEISGQAITFVDGQGAQRVLSLLPGGQLRIVALGAGRYRQPGLTIEGTGTVIPLPFFSKKDVRRQCLAAGWSFASRR